MKEPKTCETNAAKRLTGNETFHFGGNEIPVSEASVKDFWAWANSDILNNTTRGVLAEFLVAQALRLDIRSLRKEWEPYDLLDSDGETKIEVKSAAYVQSWHQDCCPKSPIKFNIKLKKVEEEKHFEDKRSCKRPWSEETKRRCDIYVFCLLLEKERDRICPRDISQWEFYVVSTQRLDEDKKLKHQQTISLSILKGFTKPVPYNKLRFAVDQEKDQSTPR